MTMRGALRSAVQSARSSPAFALYLAALALLAFKWLSPVSWLYTRAGWSDVFVALAAVAWVLERSRTRSWPRLRAVHALLAAYLALGALSALFASDSLKVGAQNLLLMAELVVLAVLTSEHAVRRERLNAIAVVVMLTSLVTAVLAVVGLGLFYVDVHTSLLGSYGDDLQASDRYARIAAGFYSSQLLGSFCIFASAVVAREDSDLPRTARRLTQAALAVTVVLSFSRAILGFVAAAAIRAGASRASRRARALALAVVLGCVGLMATLTVGHLHVDAGRPWNATYELGGYGGRLETVRTALHTAAEHPVLGAGPGSLPGTDRGHPAQAHLTPLSVAATIGFPALAVLVLFVVTLWRRRKRPTDVAIWSGLAGLGVDGLGQETSHFRHVWVMLGLADASRDEAT
jgi:hypothetical protein